jgi:polysaccharide biosynthesis/export protein
MRGVLAPIRCLVAALALAGCMGRTAPVALAYAEPASVPHDAAYTDASGPARFVVPSGAPLSPGDTVLVGERWF